MLKKYFARHFAFGTLLRPELPEGEVSVPPRRQFKPSFKLFVALLRFLPWVCGAGFALSFWWDFGSEDSLRVFGYPLELNALLRMVCVSGLIGFGTNWLAIKMLFRPVYRRPIWGQGLIPAQKDRIVWQLAGGIHKHILSEDLIRARIEESGIIKRVNKVLIQGTDNLLHDEEFREEIKALVHTHLQKNMEREEVKLRFSRIIDEKLEANLQSGVKGFIFKTYKTLNRAEYELVISKVIERVPDTVVEILEEVEDETGNLINWIREREGDLEEFFTRMVRDILERVDIREVLSRQMAHFDEARLESLIRNATNQQLLYIQYLGTLLGILGGLLIWQPLPVLILYTGLFGLLFGLDVLLYRLKTKRIENS
ncbi:MAG: DUF445 family protein [Bacteroidota bacterium]